MFFTEPLEFVTNYIESIDQGLKKYDSKLKLTRIQKSWFAFCIMGYLSYPHSMLGKI